MKFERMNENQIRCTLSREDLELRHIKIDELAYGTDKANGLFKDLMIQAANELDFIADGTPLMIEAVPTSSDSIVLTISKVDDPEELDTRFAQFAPDLTVDPEDDTALTLEEAAAIPSAPIEGSAVDIPLSRLFSLSTIDNLISLAKVLNQEYISSSSVFKDTKSGAYLLLLEKGSMDLIAFNRVCNIVSEYGESEKNLLATSAYLKEHCECIIAQDAISRLASI